MLKSRYAAVLADKCFTHVVMLRGAGPKTTRKMPIDCLSKMLASRVDIEELIGVAMAPFTKLLLTNQQKKEVSKSSDYKSEFESLSDEKQADEIIVRVVSVDIHGKVKHQQERW